MPGGPHRVEVCICPGMVVAGELFVSDARVGSYGEWDFSAAGSGELGAAP